MVQSAFGGTQSMLVIANRNLRLDGENSAEAFIRALVRPREISPGVGEALDGSGDDADAHQNHEGDKPARVEDIGQTRGIEEAQHGRGVGALHVIQFGDRALQNDGARYGKNHERNNEYDAGLDGTQGLPGFANRGAK